MAFTFYYCLENVTGCYITIAIRHNSCAASFEAVTHSTVLWYVCVSQILITITSILIFGLILPYFPKFSDKNAVSCDEFLGFLEAWIISCLSTLTG